MNAIKVMGTLVLLAGILFSLAVSIVGNHVVNTIAEQETQPESATDLIMRSRQTAVFESPNTHNARWAGAGLLAITLLTMGTIVFVIQGGADLLKQWRLAWKRPKKHSRPSHPIPYATWLDTPHVPVVPTLPEGQHEDSFDDLD